MVYDPNDVHYDQFLTNLSVGITNDDMIGDKIFPEVKVDNKSDKYYVHGTELFRPRDDVRAPGTMSTEIQGPRRSDDSYFCEEHALHIKITDEELANADASFQAEAEAVDITKTAIMLAREKYISDLVRNTATYNSDLSETVSTKWDATGANVVKSFIDAGRALHRKIFKRYNTVIFPCVAMDKVREIDDFKDRVQYTQTATVSEDLVATLLGISGDQLLIPSIGWDSDDPTANNEGDAVDVIGKSTIDYMWGEDVALLYNPPTPSIKTAAFGYEFLWTGKGRLINGIRRWRKTELKSDFVEYNRYYDLKIVTKDSAGKSLGGYLFKTPFTV